MTMDPEPTIESGASNGASSELQQRCRRCGYRVIEHDVVDLACPENEDHARANEKEWNQP